MKRDGGVGSKCEVRICSYLLLPSLTLYFSSLDTDVIITNDVTCVAVMMNILLLCILVLYTVIV